MNIERLMSENANILTAYVVSMILVVGAGVVGGEGQWYLPAIFITIVFAVFLLIKNAKTMLKIAFCVVTVLLFASFAFQVGVLLDPSALFGLTWMGAHLFLAFFLLAISYLSLSGRSRWTSVALSETMMFTVVYSLSIAAVGWLTSLFIGIAIGVVFFVLFFFVFNKVDRKGKKMPNRSIPLSEVEKFCSTLEGRWNTVVEHNAESVHIFVWNDMRAYMLVPVDMEYAFRVRTKRASLSYNGRDIRPWLFGLLSQVPYGKARGADITTVLLDIKNRNGNKVEPIGVSHPDSRHPILVGIAPAKGYQKIGQELMQDIDCVLGQFKTELSEKQKEALSGFGKI